MGHSRSKFFIAIIVLLVAVLTVYLVSFDYQKQDVTAETRTVALSEIDDQAILDRFDEVELSKEGETTTLIGYQSIDPGLFDELDNLSEQEKQEAATDSLKYRFSYNVETNVITVTAFLCNMSGEELIDSVSGVGFINDSQELDAVLNIDGEAVMLSDMREAGMIENCGFFSFLKKFAAAVAVAAAVVCVVALVVATVGAAAPVAVAAALGTTTAAVASTAGSALAIAGYAALTAAIASGVYITCKLVEDSYPGIGATDISVDGKKSVKIGWSEKSKAAITDIVKANDKKSPSERKIYFRCRSVNDVPIDIIISDPQSLNEMSNLMQGGVNSVTMANLDAYKVLKQASPIEAYLFTDKKFGLYNAFHYHAVVNPEPKRPIEDNPRYKQLHSFYYV